MSNGSITTLTHCCSCCRCYLLSSKCTADKSVDGVLSFLLCIPERLAHGVHECLEETPVVFGCEEATKIATVTDFDIHPVAVSVACRVAAGGADALWVHVWVTACRESTMGLLASTTEKRQVFWQKFRT